MDLEALIEYYLEQKIKGAMDLSLIKKELREKHNYSKEDALKITTEIGDRELEELNNHPSLLHAFVSSRYYSIIFIVFGIVTIVFSIFAIQKNVPTVFGKTLPYIVLVGGFFMVFKHISIIRKNNGRH